MFCFFGLISCGKPKVFVLGDSDNNRYYLSDSIKKVYKKGYINKAPLIAIDGVPFDYQANSDTIMLPLKKNQITDIGFINKNSSSIIYGADANNGAVVLITTALPQYTTDTIRIEKGE
jgi:hypothetical protein